MKRLFSILLTVAIAYSLLEVGVYFLFKYGMLRGDIPSFSISNIGGRFWQEIKFGAWHRPHSVFRHKKSCFDVEYHSNGEGMRDPERPRHSRQSRTVMLGDSFVEGWGLPEGKRISDLLEQATGREFLNFGTSGYVGQTHAYLLYKNLVKNFSHDEVLLGILPSNDFSDDDYEANKDKGRYIIFWKGEYPDYQLAYSAGPRNGVALSRYLYGSLREFSYTYNAVKYQFQRLWWGKKIHSDEAIPSKFYDFTEQELQRMLFSLEKIREESEGKKMSIFLEPTLYDLKRYDAVGKSPLALQLEAWGSRHGVQVIDLLPWMHDYTEDWEKYYFNCDDHWNAYGDQVAFEYLKTRLYPDTGGTSEK